MRPASRKGLASVRRSLDAVDAHGEAHAVCQRHEPPALVLADDGVGDEEVVEAGVGEHLRLADLRDGEAPRARRALKPADLAGTCGSWRGDAAARPRRAPGSAMRAMLRSSTSRSTRTAGVERSSRLLPITRARLSPVAVRGRSVTGRFRRRGSRSPAGRLRRPKRVVPLLSPDRRPQAKWCILTTRLIHRMHLPGSFIPQSFAPSRAEQRPDHIDSGAGTRADARSQSREATR